MLKILGTKRLSFSPFSTLVVQCPFNDTLKFKRNQNTQPGVIKQGSEILLNNTLDLLLLVIGIRGSNAGRKKPNQLELVLTPDDKMIVEKFLQFKKRNHSQ
uniref:Uncharacterized protein n=1 Tax=Micrurus surinamensis TaxID=129470 RepID=A0A2D4PH29_MICSU